MGHEQDRVVSGLICPGDLSKVREAVCVQTEKIYDSCKEKDCIEDARVLFRCPEKVQRIIDAAINVKIRNAEVVDIYADVEPVPFKRGFYTVDVKFFIKVTLDFFVPRMPNGTRIVTVNGLVLFDKKVILFGSEGGVKIFKAQYVEGGIDQPVRNRLQQDNLPVSKIEVAEPIALNARIVEVVENCREDYCCDPLPRNLNELLGEEGFEDYIDDIDVLDDERHHHTIHNRVLASVGLFSIIKLVRYVQLLVPAFDFCVPNKTCISSTDENPCELFDTIEFPVDEFFPPQKFDFPGASEAENKMREDL